VQDDDSPSPEGPKVRAVKLSVFLQTLLRENLGISGEEKLRTKFLSTVSGLWINFTHFVQLTGPLNDVTPSFLREAWSSGTAFQRAYGQPVVDGFFVCYAGDLDACFIRYQQPHHCSLEGEDEGQGDVRDARQRIVISSHSRGL